ncbi:phosphoenolpyruvate synthase [Paenibacillus daejeonensis]|uniref:phosphoenolpyruvate synthase n=1 Tax=Paenibacillus daejeonensis TaxID=135193 RepID=UPI0003673421|nr:phosphoenolpyruvate synthase [Paenibacillus daejeonensis]
MNHLVLDLKQVDRTQVLLAGGKGTNLGELSKLRGIRVPDGFTVTTTAFRLAMDSNASYTELLDRLSRLSLAEREEVMNLSRAIRETILSTAIPPDTEQAICHSLSHFDDDQAYAVRSSATAEDLPHASFAGQHDTYLNVIGRESVLQHVRACWASLYTDRAVFYRMQQGIDHNQVFMSVTVQQMINAQASGILFTADPLTSNRKRISIDAGVGLGEALVSGQVTADQYIVQEGEIVSKRYGSQHEAVYGSPGGGTIIRPLESTRPQLPALTDEQILNLATLGRQIEADMGGPQDIEWCLMDDNFYIVQSRPITTLFPIPESPEEGNRVYVSVGHQQMMTDPIKPLGLSFFLMTTPAPMRVAGGRLFVDVTAHLASPASRDQMIGALGTSDPLMKDALMTVVAREGYINMAQDNEHGPRMAGTRRETAERAAPDASIVPELIHSWEASLAELQQTIHTKTGTALFDFILQDMKELKRLLFDASSSAVIMTGMGATAWINEHMLEWLGEQHAADKLSQSLANNVTSEMGLALMDVADVIRPYPEVVHYLQQAATDGFMEDLVSLEGGVQAKQAIEAYLAKYGMRCPGEIDLTRRRWSENPFALVPVLLGHIKNEEPHASKRRFEQGLQEAQAKEKELLDRLREQPDGERKALETKQRMDQIRLFSGYREYPKYGMINRYFVYKQALLQEAGHLKQAGMIPNEDAIYYLTFEELRDTVRTQQLNLQLIHDRIEDYTRYEKLTPPRVMTSDGEILTGEYRREHLPEGALAGLPVSTGIIEGRARVMMGMQDALPEEGDILVTAFTDPGWTPLFVSIKGLVTEVGGLMTHGAVIAREYGLPAVVGVVGATTRIQDGQRIRVNGAEGWVEILS